MAQRCIVLATGPVAMLRVLRDQKCDGASGQQLVSRAPAVEAS